MNTYSVHNPQVKAIIVLFSIAVKSMKLLRNADKIPSGTVLTTGNFDGLHLGHQALLKQLRKTADQMNLPLCVLLFEPQPSEYFHKEEAVPRLFSLREKIRLMKNLGVDYVYCLTFNKKLSQMDAVTFAEKYLFQTLNAKYMLIGEDFHFGYQRQGNVALLQSLAIKHHCAVSICPDFLLDNRRVSSTAIRQALTSGNLVLAARMLGRPYGFCAKVVKGRGVGRQWGIPTANMLLHNRKLPLKGVFCVKVRHENTTLYGVANIGTRPTVDGSKTILEIHLLDYTGILYDAWLTVSFLHKLRDEIRFASVDALIAQIHADIEQTRQYFNKINREELHHG